MVFSSRAKKGRGLSALDVALLLDIWTGEIWAGALMLTSNPAAPRSHLMEIHEPPRHRRIPADGAVWNSRAATWLSPWRRGFRAARRHEGRRRIEAAFRRRKERRRVDTRYDKPVRNFPAG